jgi:protein-tyrosine phosphatase
MDHSNLRLLRYLIGEDTLGKVSLLLEWADVSRDVADPWYTGDFEAAYQDILQGCQAFLKAV